MVYIVWGNTSVDLWVCENFGCVQSNEYPYYTAPFTDKTPDELEHICKRKKSQNK